MDKTKTKKAGAMLVQKHQLGQAENKLSELDQALSALTAAQNENNSELDQMLLDMENLLSKDKGIPDFNHFTANYTAIENELGKAANKPSTISQKISTIDAIEIDEDTSWEEYLQSVDKYAFKKNIDLTSDPYRRLMTNSQRIALEKRIKEEFTFKTASCDKYDYMIAGTCGVIGGLVDIFFVGILGKSKLGDLTDKFANSATEKFAETLGWPKEKAVEKGKNTTASAIGWLENKFKINYDQATTNGKNGTDGKVKNLSLSNHHIKSLGHSPDIIGLFFSILNQFTSTSTFISNGEIITIDTDTFELQGDNFIAKIFCGFANWFGHVISDMSGSSGSVGKGGRGTGVPIPFYNLFLMFDVGEFGQHKQTFAQISTKVFEQGYDFRHGIAMAIPVLLTELLVRFMWSMKNHYYHKNNWTDSIPKTSNPELRRMLLVGHGTLCIIDGADAALRSGGDMMQFLLRTNIIAWARFGTLALKELNNWYKSGHIDPEAVDYYLDEELQRLLEHKSMLVLHN